VSAPDTVRVAGPAPSRSLAARVAYVSVPPCPIVALEVSAFSCGEFMAEMEGLGRAGRLVGFAIGP